MPLPGVRMKTYTVIRSTSGQVGCVVSDPTGPLAGARLLPHCAYHSQTGFETGYSGSGPADLALSILADHFHATPEQIEHVARHGFLGKSHGAEKALLFHQSVKFRFIACAELKPGESYVVTAGDIDAYIEEITRRDGVPA